MEATSELALRVIGSMALSPRLVRPEDETALADLLEQMVPRYPHQDLQLSMEGYYRDYLVLVERYGIEAVRQALQELRVMPGQRFFPQPSECAEVAEVIVSKRKEDEKVAAIPKLCGKCMGGMVRVFRDGNSYVRPCRCQLVNKPAETDRKVMAAGS
jgi:hypothetical protein